MYTILIVRLCTNLVPSCIQYNAVCSSNCSTTVPWCVKPPLHVFGTELLRVTYYVLRITQNCLLSFDARINHTIKTGRRCFVFWFLTGKGSTFKWCVLVCMCVAQYTLFQMKVNLKSFDHNFENILCAERIWHMTLRPTHLMNCCSPL